MKKVLIWLLIVFGLLIAIGYSYRRSLAFVKSRRTPAINQVSPEVSHQPVETGQAGTKPFTFLAGTAEMISYYNQQASDQDYIYFFENSLLRNRQAQIEDYKKVAKGKIIQSFASYQNAEAEGLIYPLENISGDNKIFDSTKIGTARHAHKPNTHRISSKNTHYNKDSI